MEKIFVTRASLPPFEEYTKMLERIWDSAWLTNMGIYHEELEKLLNERLESENISLFTNGHLALEMLLEAFELKGEVITTPFSFASTTHAIVRKGLTPVFCDIKEDDYTIDVSKIEPLITKDTSAILAVHVYGNICDIAGLERICKKYGIKLIFDAAHAFYERCTQDLDDGGGRKSVAVYGDASMFSFHATKVFNTIEGGAACCREPGIKEKLDRLKNFGILDKENVLCAGGNAKMNEFQAAMGICNLKHIDEMIFLRKRIVERYIERLEGIKGIILNNYKNNIEYNYAYMPIRIERPAKNNEGISSRDMVYNALAQQGIYARKYFYPCINEYECYKKIYKNPATPAALKISQQIITLPVYPQLDMKIVDKICDIIIKVLD